MRRGGHREFWHSFVSLPSGNGVPPEEISRVMGHRGTAGSEAVCLWQIRPVVQGGAVTMDRVLAGDTDA